MILSDSSGKLELRQFIAERKKASDPLFQSERRDSLILNMCTMTLFAWTYNQVGGECRRGEEARQPRRDATAAAAPRRVAPFGVARPMDSPSALRAPRALTAISLDCASSGGSQP